MSVSSHEVSQVVPHEVLFKTADSPRGSAAVSPLIEISNLCVDFDLGQRYVRALHDVSLSVGQGEVIGMVGESGCGKSITWLAALGLLGSNARVTGSVRLAGQELLGQGEKTLATVRGGKVAMIFQDPTSSLNPVHRIGTQLIEALQLHRGMDMSRARTEAKRLLDRVGISNAPQRLNEYPHEMSGGMNQRVMIAMALAGEPDMLIADEPTTALDVTIQAQILDLLRVLCMDEGMSLVLISHDLGVIADMADRVFVMYCGRIIEMADVDTLFDRHAHQYTQGLIAALPDLSGPKVRLSSIPGTVPPPDKLPLGCSFAPRCDHSDSVCHNVLPGLALRQEHPAKGHHVACHRPLAVSDQKGATA